MNCQHCKVKIGAEFVYALKKNECPACSKQIMAQDNLVAFLSLQELLKQNTSNVDIDKVASLIIANFDVKQRFVKVEAVKEKNIDMPIEVETINDGIDNDTIKKNEELEAQKLKRMRDEVLAEMTYEKTLKDALSENPSYDEPEISTVISKRPQQGGKIDYAAILNENENIGDDIFLNENSVVNKILNKQANSQNTVLSGAGGKNSFRRS